MNLDELQKAWKSQETRTTVRTVLLLDSIRKTQKRHNMFIWLRNIREGWGIILGSLLFIYCLESDVATKLQLWPCYLAMVILFGIGVFRVIDNRRQKQRLLQYNDSSLSFIEFSLLNIKHRIWLLENMFWWFILPVAVGGILVVGQIIWIVGLEEPAVLFWRLGTGVVIFCVILGVAYWGNLWTARKYWQPRKAELEAIADSLKTT